MFDKRKITFTAMSLCFSAMAHAAPITPSGGNCPDRKVEELEQAVVEFWQSKRNTPASRATAESFFRKHEFERDGAVYTSASSLWGIPFSMTDPKTDRSVKYFAIVGCAGSVELSVLDRAK